MAIPRHVGQGGNDCGSILNPKLRVQVATSDVRWIEDLTRIACSLEAVEGEEMGRGRARRSPVQAWFAEEGEGYKSHT